MVALIMFTVQGGKEAALFCGFSMTKVGLNGDECLMLLW